MHISCHFLHAAYVEDIYSLFHVAELHYRTNIAIEWSLSSIVYITPDCSWCGSYSNSFFWWHHSSEQCYPYAIHSNLQCDWSGWKFREHCFRNDFSITLWCVSYDPEYYYCSVWISWRYFCFSTIRLALVMVTSLVYVTTGTTAFQCCYILPCYITHIYLLRLFSFCVWIRYTGFIPP